MDDMRLRGKEVLRNRAFDSYEQIPAKIDKCAIQVNYKGLGCDDIQPLLTEYLIGCMYWLGMMLNAANYRIR